MTPTLTSPSSASQPPDLTQGLKRYLVREVYRALS